MKSTEEGACAEETIDGSGDGIGIVGVGLQVEFLNEARLSDGVGYHREPISKGQTSQCQDQNHSQIVQGVRSRHVGAAC